MADNLALPALASVVATDDIAGVHHQLVKIEFGAADSAALSGVAQANHGREVWRDGADG